MAQAVVLSVPNLWQVIVDDTAGTQTFQTYDTSTNAWVTQWTLNLSTGAVTLAQSQTVSGDLSVAGNQSVGGTVSVTGAVTLSNALNVAGQVTISETLVVDNYLAATVIEPSVGVTSISGTTAGTIYWTMPFQGTGYKKAVVYLDAYENDTATAQTITYPAAFGQIPNIYNSNAVPGISTTRDALSIDPDTTTAYTGWIIVEGF